MSQKFCDVCSGGFTPTGRNQKRCSWACARNHRNNWVLGERDRKCDICGEGFTASIHNQKRCSEKCVRVYQTQWMGKWAASQPKTSRAATCTVCRGSFLNSGKANRITCSPECGRQQRNATSKKHAKSERRREYMRQYGSTPDRRLYQMLRNNLSVRIHTEEKLRTSKYAPYTCLQLRKHLEDQFTSGMSWATYGRRGWHVDHIKPLTAFKFINSDGSVRRNEVRKAMALTNLQPLWAADNIRKGGM